jgi:hypothetical protein
LLAAQPEALRDVTYPLSLVGSGRRVGAGPGLQPTASAAHGHVLVTIAMAAKVTRTEESE